MKILVAVARPAALTKLQNALARQLGRAGHTVDVQTVDDSPTVEAYDAAVTGSAVYMGKWLPRAEQFVDLYQEQLAAMPVWLLNSGPLGFDDPEP